MGMIDSNLNTIRMLEPLVEEINMFQSKFKEFYNDNGEIVTGKDSHMKEKVNPKTSTNDKQMSTPLFSFQLEKRNISPIHLNAICRIYGEYGEEILDLLRKNPAGTIPVILKRLRQKDMEWRRTRQTMNNQWREVVEKNHYRSFDHRSF